MDSARQKEEKDPNTGRDTIDKQVEARWFYNNEWKLVVNVPLEQNLLEISQWRRADNLKFDVEPGGKADIEQTTPAKYVLKHFITEDNFLEEKKSFWYDIDKYWTGIWYTWLRKDIIPKYKLKENITIEEWWVRNDKNYDQYIQCNRHFMPKNVNIRLFWIDDRTITSPKLQDAEDCIMWEYLSPEEIENRRWKDKNFNLPEDIDNYTTSNQYESSYKTDEYTQQCFIYYYYNKLTKDYAVVLDNQKIIHRGKMLYSDWLLPFQSAQCYTRNHNFYGSWIPRKIWYLKAYKSEILQNILDGAWMTSWINMIVWNWNSVDWQLYTSPWEMNIRETTGDVWQIQQIRMDANIGQLSWVLTLVDDLIIQDVWDNIKAPYSTPAWTLWEAEIMEENKTLRVKSRDENFDIALWYALTQSLQNIKDFAPATLRKVTKVDWDIEKVERPSIKVKNVTIKKEKGKTVFEEDYWKYGFFELKPETLMWDMTVNITTGSTSMRNLKTINRWKYKEFIENYTMLLNALPDEQKQELMSNYPISDVVEYMKETFEVDDKLTAQTKKDQIKKKNIEKIEQLNKLLAPDDLDVWQTMEQPQGTPTAPQWQPTAPQGTWWPQSNPIWL